MTIAQPTHRTRSLIHRRRAERVGAGLDLSAHTRPGAGSLPPRLPVARRSGAGYRIYSAAEFARNLDRELAGHRLGDRVIAPRESRAAASAPHVDARCAAFRDGAWRGRWRPLTAALVAGIVTLAVSSYLLIARTRPARPVDQSRTSAAPGDSPRAARDAAAMTVVHAATGTHARGMHSRTTLVAGTLPRALRRQVATQDRRRSVRLAEAAAGRVAAALARGREAALARTSSRPTAADGNAQFGFER